jgi:hypothetical protein
LKQTISECSFSIELKSKEYLKTISLVNGNHESVLVEGTIGQLQHAEFVECIVLEVTGTKGILRIDLSREHIQGENKAEVKNQ